MDNDIIEDVVGAVNYTTSADSIETVQYSNDFEINESTSVERINSSGKETYVIDYDSENSTISCTKNRSIDRNITSLGIKKCFNQQTNINFEDISLIEQVEETENNQPKAVCTQTSKTILEIAEKEGLVKKPSNPVTYNLETQTSLLVIDENRNENMDYLVGEADIEVSPILEADVKSVSFNEPFANVEQELQTNYADTGVVRLEILTPLTEESSIKSMHEPLQTITADYRVVYDHINMKQHQNSIESLNVIEENSIKLPPIISCPTSPHIILFSQHDQSTLDKSLTLPCLIETPSSLEPIKRWQADTLSYYRENSNIGGRYDSREVCLPSVHLNQLNDKLFSYHIDSQQSSRSRYTDGMTGSVPSDVPLLVRKRLKELKTDTNKGKKYGADSSCVQRKHCSGISKKNVKLMPLQPIEPDTIFQHGDYNDRNTDNASHERNIDDKHKNTCAEVQMDWMTVYHNIMDTLSSDSWLTIVEVLDNISTILTNHWIHITEHQLTNILRQVNQYVDSPRSLVSRSACFAIGNILKMSSFTNGPDFYECVAALVSKTGSSNKTIRRAANVALDDIVSTVGLHHAVRAICGQGVTHKSPLVRCATARLLVCCLALAGGNQPLLKSNLPGSVVAARRKVLQALSLFIEDKNTETRKYAERLYRMLRPHKNFEAYFLTDIDMEIAIQQIKKYDALLMKTTD